MWRNLDCDGTKFHAPSPPSAANKLLVVCDVAVVGGWYLQPSLMQLHLQVMEQCYHYQEQTKHIEKLNKQIVTHNN